MKPLFRVSVADLLFSAMLGALVVMIHRWLFKPTPPATSRNEAVYNQEPRYQARRRLPPV